MEPRELKEIRRTVEVVDENDETVTTGLTVVAFARAIGYQGTDNTVSDTIRKYEGGRKPIPPWIARLAEMFSRYGVPDDFLNGAGEEATND